MPPDEPLTRLHAALAGRYRIERQLGAGGMATVHLAVDEKHDRKVALKVLRPAIAAALGHERFLQEIKTTASLHHPHILPLYDSGLADGFLYYVMPYVEGESLRDRLAREKQLPIEEALRVTREVGDALSYAHSHGVIHRDIKPENILLESGHAVVADFGIARAIHAAGGEKLTQTGVTIGTPAYMSPESCAGSQELDGRSDLYSLGCVLYEMLAGQPPFTGPSAESLVYQHLSAAPPPVTQLRPAVPAEIAGVLARALAKNPADRFNPVVQFTEALAPRGGLVAAPVAARRAPRWRVALPAALALLVAAVVVWLAGREPRFVAGETTRVTLDPGLEIDPALSPDGEMIAYAAGVPGRMQIYVRRLSGGRTIALTADTTNDHRWPRWTREGAQVAYQADSTIWVAPALGGVPRPLLRLAGAPKGFDLSPEGNRVGYALRGRVYVQDLRGGASAAVGPAVYDAHSVAWSPDGARLAYVVGNSIFVFGGPNQFGNEASSAVWVVSPDGSKPVRVSDDKALNVGPAWAPDGRALFWVSNREGTRDIYRVRLNRSGGAARPAVRLTTGLNAMGLSLDRAGARLACSVLAIYSNIWSIEVPRSAPISIARARPVTSGNQMIESLDISRDGRWLAFDSDRGGNFDIYKMPVEGGDVVQLTTDPGKDFWPRWSPDGRAIAFHSMRAGNRDVFTIAADGSGETQRTHGPEEEWEPSWSPDGRALLFHVLSKKGDYLRILPLSGEGSPRDLAVPITPVDAGYWSPAGGLICYSSAEGLDVFDEASGESRVLVPPTGGPAEPAWAPDGRTIYYGAGRPSVSSISSVSVEGGTPRRLVDLDDPSRPFTRYGLATDGRRFYVTLGSKESDVWMMKLERR